MAVIKTSLVYLAIFALAFAGFPVLAQPNLVPATVQPSGQIVSVPITAVQVAPHVFDLGVGIDPVSGKKVQGLMFVHYRDGNTHKPQHNPGGGSGNGGGPSKCFAYLANGAKWKTVEDWVMNPSNASALDGSTVFATQAASLEKWEDATDGVVGNGAGVNIFDNGTLTDATLVADTDSPDGLNEVYFADISSTGAIAVTIVWGIFVGPPSGRELVEWDQVYDDVDFDWSLDGEALKMDFDNIATHENGHAAGMGHPDDSCTEETMYRFADFGEIKKRDLNSGDIAGIDKLY